MRVDVDDDSLVATATRVRTAIAHAAAAGARGGLMVTVGGDCGVELEPVAAARLAYGDRLVVVWFDAHGDVNTPDSSPSGAYHGMVLRALTGEGPQGLVPDACLDPGRIVLAGVRDLDPAEADFVAAAGIRRWGVEEDPAALVAAVASAGGEPEGRASAGGEPEGRASAGSEADNRTAAGGEADGRTAAGAPDSGASDGGASDGGASDGERDGRGSDGRDPVVYVHVDFDVLDPEIFRSVGCPSPGGLHPERLLSSVAAVAERFEVVGLGLMEYEPSRDEDQELLSGLVSGLVAVCARR